MAAANLRRLTTFDLTCIGINAIVGSGIFANPGRIAKGLGPASILAVLLCGFLCVPLALGFAKAAGRFESSGSTYVYAREAFGPRVGFAVGWLSWTNAVISWAAVALMLAPNVGRFLPALAIHEGRMLAVFAIVGLAALNIVGVRPSAWLTDSLTVVKLLPLVAVLVVGWIFAAPARLTPFAPEGYGAMGPAMFIALFAYQGFEVVAVPAGEAKSAPRAAPRAVMIAFAVPLILYAGLQAVAVMHVPGLSTSKTPLVDAALALGGVSFATVVGLGAVISIFGFNAGSALTSPRYLSAMADARQVPASLGRLHQRFATPYWSIVVTAAVAVILCTTLPFNRLVDLSNASVLPQYLVTMAALARFMIRPPAGTEKLEMPGGLFLPALGAAVSLYLLAQSSWSERYFVAVVVALGLALAAAVERASRRP